MKILFVAKHGEHDNSDEDAVAFALEKLGHQVIKVHELQRHRNGVDPLKVDADMCLFFKWESYFEVAEIAKRMPVFCWYFDLISSTDQTLAKRMEFRRMWFDRMLPHLTLFFCTDGDWVVQRDDTDKMRWLMQGMDERVAGLGTRSEVLPPPILFTGTPNHGEARRQQISLLQDRYKDKFQMIGAGGPNGRIHGRNLADLFASVKCVVAPIGPVTNLYWSNRVYLTTGLGGALLHPSTFNIHEHYSGMEIVYYDGIQDCYNVVEQMIDTRWEVIDIWRQSGFNRTMAEHTYFHRCQTMMKWIQEVL